MYFLIGTVNGFLVQNINTPFCMYVFGGVDNKKVTYSQCRISSSFLQLPWSWKIFYALFLDRVAFFGSRRRGWIVFGWTVALAVQVYVALVVQSFVDSGDFFGYNCLLLASCFFYMFADVSADGLCVELSRYEPQDRKGYVLTTCQMTRFTGTALVLMVSTFLMNGPAMYPPTPGEEPSTLFSFGFNISQVHWFIVITALPFWLVMVCFLREPPKPAGDVGHTTKQAFQGLWTMIRTKAMFMMIVFNIAYMALSSLGNPASSAFGSIVRPTPMLMSLSGVLGRVLFILGVWIFRRYFMQTNWRFTMVWTHLLTCLESLFAFGIIYNVFGIGQSGWFYCFGDSILEVVSGIAQVLGSLVACEIAIPGLEASAYEILSTVHNNALTLNNNLGNTLLNVFHINNITGSAYPANKDLFNGYMRDSTVTTLCINLGATLIFVWCLPANKEMTQRWRDNKAWHNNFVGIVGVVVLVTLFIYATTLSILSMAGSCLKLAGGPSC